MNFTNIIEWLHNHETLILVFFILSFVFIIVSIVTLVVTINIIPADFFLNEKKKLISNNNRYFFLSIIKLILKNILGIVLLILGIIMLFLPGQGILTILISLLLISFPGKWKMIQYLVRKKKVMETMNWIRSRFGKEELSVPK